MKLNKVAMLNEVLHKNTYMTKNRLLFNIHWFPTILNDLEWTGFNRPLSSSAL